MVKLKNAGLSITILGILFIILSQPLSRVEHYVWSLYLVSSGLIILSTYYMIKAVKD